MPDGPAPSVERYGFDVRPVWRRDDPEAKADAIALWRRNGLLPPDVDPEARAEELVAIAYKDGKLAAVSTATLQRIETLRARFAVMRGATDAEFRRSKAQRALIDVQRETLSAWAIANPGERLAGLACAVNAAEWGELTRLPIWPESGYTFVGYNPDGSQLRVRWFDHFAFGDEPTVRPLELPELGDYAGIEFRDAWKRDDPQIEADAIDFWKRLNILPSGVAPEDRAKEVVVAAYHERRIVGLMTAQVERIEPLRARLAMNRGAVDPEYRRRRIGRMMMFMCLPILEQWSRAHPEERVAGVGGIVQSAVLQERARWPHSPNLRYMLAGFTKEGDQLRVYWFEDFRLD